jgi:hypothetical protein
MIDLPNPVTTTFSDDDDIFNKFYTYNTEIEEEI